MAWKGKKMTKAVKSNKERVREMTILAMFIAIIVVMAFVPFLGFITIGAVSATIIPIPVMIGGVILGRKNGIILGLTFGVVSLIRGAMSANFDFLFVFPWVSVLPRFLFGLLIYDTYRFFKKLLKIQILSLVVSFFVLSMLHSLLVLPMLLTTFPIVMGNASLQTIVGESLSLIQGTTTLSAAFSLILAVLVSNSLIEALLAATIGAIVCDRLIVYLNINTKKVSE